MSRYFLGVDGGQSSTAAWVGDECGRVIGVGVGGGCHQPASLSRSVRAACKSARIDPEGTEFRAACLGFSGGGEAKLSLATHEIRARDISVTDDTEIALLGATGGEPGIATIAGTGSISYGRNAEGRSARAGGWGYLLCDEGGAMDIVRQAVRAALRFEQRWGPPTRLHQALLDRTRARTVNELIHRFYRRGYSRSRIASHASLVDRVAAEGDPVAREVLGSAAQQLATYTDAVRQQLFEPDEPVTVACVGGVFHSEIVRERFRLLVELDPANHVQPPLHEPVVGALIAAYRLAGLSVALSPPSGR